MINISDGSHFSFVSCEYTDMHIMWGSDEQKVLLQIVADTDQQKRYASWKLIRVLGLGKPKYKPSSYCLLDATL